MKLIRYFLNKAMLPLYILAAAVMSMVIALFSDELLTAFLRMLPIVLCLLIALRAFDDASDYEKDSGRKTQHLSKRGLVILAWTMSAVYVLLNILLYGMWGAVSIAAVAYILLMDKLPVFKTAYMALLFLYYFRLNCTGIGIAQLAVCAGCLAVSAVFHIYKLHRRKDRK